MSPVISSSSLPLPPGPSGLPIIGALPKFLKAAKANPPHIAISKMAAEYGDVFRIDLGNLKTVVVAHPELIAEAFRKRELSDRYPIDVFVRLSGKRGLIYAELDDNWENLSPFSEHKLWSRQDVASDSDRHFAPAIDEVVKRMTEISDAGDPVNIHRVLLEADFNMTFRTLFGWPDEVTDDFLEMRETMRGYISWLVAACSEPSLTDFFPWTGIFLKRKLKELDRNRDLRDALLARIVKAVEHRRAEGAPAVTGMIDLMLDREKEGGITRDRIYALCTDILVAIPAGVAATVTWLLLIVANRPGVQTRIHEELDREIGSGAPPTGRDRGRLPYLFACVAESMRYRTIAPLALPHRAMQDAEIGGYRIPANSQVYGSIYAVHHDPRFWESPDEFIPERFMPGPDGSPSAALTSLAYMPFGIGVRRCTGDLFAVEASWLHAARILHRLRFDTPEDTPLPEDEVLALSIEPKPFALRVTARPRNAPQAGTVDTQDDSSAKCWFADLVICDSLR